MSGQVLLKHDVLDNTIENSKNTIYVLLQSKVLNLCKCVS